jgi:epoxyqueuosine reductase QueG
MDPVFRAPLTADDIKAKAKSFGADIAGIADGKVMDEFPPDPDNPRRPSDVTDYDAGHAIVLGKRLLSGPTRLPRWDERHKYYNDELTLTMLEEAALELALWLESQGYPALIIPPTHVDPWLYFGKPAQHLSPLLSASHAAVEAGLGTLGLNGQLLTPEFGPRLMVTIVLCSLDVEPDVPMTETLCKGPTCGRCLSACPGDVVGHWDRDWQGCDSYRSPHGFKAVSGFLQKVLAAPDADAQMKLVRSEESFNIWQSTLRGAGVVTGCRRCQDVCPVGADYAKMLEDALDEIAEDNPDKQARLAGMVEAENEGRMPAAFVRQKRWIGGD